MRIWLDAGHGGTDPGAVGHGMQEKNINLTIVMATAQILRGVGYEVGLSRGDDSAVSREERARLANAWKADLFVSVHANAHTGTATGYESFVHPTATERARGIGQRIHNHMAYFFGLKGFRDRGLKEADFAVLRLTTMPAVLIECLFLDNPTDAAWLAQPANLAKVANELAWIVMQLPDVAASPAPTGTAILGEPLASVAQAQAWAESRGAHPRFVAVAPLYWQYGRLMGIRPEILFSQAAKETRYGLYGGQVAPDQNNWAGIKTAEATGDRPEDHETFATPEEGVRAHFNHMGAYAGVPPIGIPHGRWHVVQSLSWAGTIRTVEELGGKWAPAADYGQSIVFGYLERLLATEAPAVVDWQALVDREARRADELQARLDEIVTIAKGE